MQMIRTAFSLLLGISLFAVILGSARAADDDDEDTTETPKLSPTITCTDYKANFERAVRDLGGVLPVPVYKPRNDVPTNMLLANYAFAQAVLGCDASGMFEGISATLIEREQGGVQWRALVTVSIQAMDRGYTFKKAEEIFQKLEDGATQWARKNKSEPGGTYGGNDETFVGNYVVDYGLADSYNRYSIDTRYEPSK